MSISIFVPTRGRIDRQITKECWFLDDQPFPVTYVVPECEAHAFLHRWPGVKILTVPDDLGIAEIRQFILNNAESDHHIVLDDDLLLYERNSFGRLRRADSMGATKAFTEMAEYLAAGYVHGGIGHRFHNEAHDDVEFGQRIIRVHAYNARAVRILGFDFARMKIASDAYFTLFLLASGYWNFCLWSFAHACKVEYAEGPEDGGIGRYRTAENRLECLRWLVEQYPNYCSLTADGKLRMKTKKAINENIVGDGIWS